MLNSIVNFSIISSIFTCSVKTIRRIKLNYDQHGSVEDLPRSGRPSVTTEREKRRIVRKHKRNRFLTAAETSHGERNSERTVRRLLRSSGIHCRRPLRRPILTSRRRQARLRWAISKSSWTVEDWVKFCSQTNHAFVWMLIQEASDYGEQMAPVILEGMSTNFDQKVLWSGEAFRESISQTWFWWLERSMPSGILVMCSRQKFCPFSERPPTFLPCNKITRPHMWHRLHYPTWETKISCFCRGLPSVQTSTPLNMSGHGWKNGWDRKIHKIWWVWQLQFWKFGGPYQKTF